MVLSDDVVRDLIDLGWKEFTSQADGTAPSNSAISLAECTSLHKSGKKIDCALDISLRAELEK